MTGFRERPDAYTAFAAQTELVLCDTGEPLMVQGTRLDEETLADDDSPGEFIVLILVSLSNLSSCLLSLWWLIEETDLYK